MVNDRTRRMSRMPTWRCLIARVLRRYRHRDPWGFCWRITIERLVLALLAGLPVLIILAWIERDDELATIACAGVLLFLVG